MPPLFLLAVFVFCAWFWWMLYWFFVLPTFTCPLYGFANRILRPQACDPRSHSFLVVRIISMPVWLFDARPYSFLVGRNVLMALRPLIFLLTPFWWCEELVQPLGLFLGCWVFDRDIPHKSTTAQPNLVLTVIDIRNLPRLGFVSMSDFLDLVWGKVRIELTRYRGPPH